MLPTDLLEAPKDPNISSETGKEIMGLNDKMPSKPKRTPKKNTAQGHISYTESDHVITDGNNRF